MRKNLIVILSVFCLLAMPFSSVSSMEMGISYVVNDRMISDLQVKERMKLIMSSSGIPDTAENRSKLLPQIQGMLIDEAIKLDAAEAQGIEVAPDEINDGIARIAQQNNFSLGQFQNLLKSQGIPRTTLENQVRSEIAWGKYIQKELRPMINITDYDIDAELERLKEDPKFSKNLPTREQVLNKIGNERLGRLQARTLMDLKSGAFIESRG